MFGSFSYVGVLIYSIHQPTQTLFLQSNIYIFFSRPLFSYSCSSIRSSQFTGTEKWLCIDIFLYFTVFYCKFFCSDVPLGSGFLRISFGAIEVIYFYVTDFDFPSTVSRLERLDHLAQKFKHKCDIHEEWTTGKEGQLQAQDFKQCRLNELKVRPVAPPPLRS